MASRRKRVFDLTRAERTDAITPPVDRGRLWYDFQIADQFLEGLPTVTDKLRWVRAHLPRATRVKIGKDSAWYEADILAWRESLQPRAHAS